jgi:hypothetical protein
MTNKHPSESLIEFISEANDINNQEVMENLSVAELAYCAGVIDSDGTIGIRKRLIKEPKRKPYLNYMEIIAVGQVSNEAVSLLKEIFGGNVMIRKSSTENGKDIFIWRVQQKKAQFCLETLLPFLRIKKTQAINCLEFRKVVEKSKEAKRQIKGQVGSLSRSQFFTNEMEKFYLRAKELNKVGNL